MDKKICRNSEIKFVCLCLEKADDPCPLIKIIRENSSTLFNMHCTTQEINKNGANVTFTRVM